MDDGAGSYHRFLAGDEEAFGEVMERYRENLIFFLDRYVRCLSVAEELAEDTFVELLLHPYRGGRGASLKTYLFTIGRNKALNAIKRASRLSPRPLEDMEADIADRHSLEERLLREERRAQVSRALDILPEDYRTVLHLLYFEEMSHREAARVMRKSEKQIDNLSYRARRAMREVLEKEGFCYEEL